MRAWIGPRGRARRGTRGTVDEAGIGGRPCRQVGRGRCGGPGSGEEGLGGGVGQPDHDALSGGPSGPGGGPGGGSMLLTGQTGPGEGGTSEDIAAPAQPAPASACTRPGPGSPFATRHPTAPSQLTHTVPEGWQRRSLRGGSGGSGLARRVPVAHGLSTRKPGLEAAGRDGDSVEDSEPGPEGGTLPVQCGLGSGSVGEEGHGRCCWDREPGQQAPTRRIKSFGRSLCAPLALRHIGLPTISY